MCFFQGYMKALHLPILLSRRWLAAISRALTEPGGSPTLSRGLNGMRTPGAVRIVIGLIAALIAVLVGGLVWFAVTTMMPADDRAFVEGDFVFAAKCDTLYPIS